MDEFSLIDKIKKILNQKNERVLIGIGDDSAVLVPPKGNLITTTDCLVESVHFDLNYMQPEELGHKALAVNLSDIAAMGGTPLYVLVSLGIRSGISEEFILKMYDGIKNIAGMFKVAVVGGNITQSPEKLFVDVTIIGEAENYWTRSGASEGDLIAVTGKLGGSACGLKLLQKDAKISRTKYPLLTSAHLKPIPRVLEANAMMKIGGVTSAIDISDGLSSELNHLSKASGFGMSIEEAKVPFASGLEEACATLELKALDLALNGGEDYELLVTVQPDFFEQTEKAVRGLGTKLTKVGIVTGKNTNVSIPSGGWTHF